MHQQDRVKGVLTKANVPKDDSGLKEYLKINRDRLDDALDELEDFASKAEVEDFIRQQRGKRDQIIRYGRSLGGEPRYVKDPTDMLGNGKDALFMVGYGVVSFEWSRFIAPTLADAVEAVIAGECFYERPMLGKQK